MTCDTCHWWEHPFNAYQSERWAAWARSSLGLCRCDDPNRWHAHTLPYIDDVELTPVTAIIEHDEDWGLLTGPKFFCAHWKVKP